MADINDKKPEEAPGEYSLDPLIIWIASWSRTGEDLY